MLVLGVNAGSTKNGKKLKDGGVCVIEDGKIIVAIAEERISRVKYAGGFSHSLPYILKELAINLDEFDSIVISSCCESVPENTQFVELNLRDPSLATYIPSHHLSHAYSAFFVSPFEQAIIIIMDAGGNIIGPQSKIEWWLNSREQNSYYIGQGDKITLIGRDFDRPLEAGFGEVYRAFTYYLGWHSFTFSSNTMALAAYGDPERYKDLRLFDFDNGNLKSRMVNDPKNPLRMVVDWAKEQGISIPQPCRVGNTPTEEQIDFASFVQRELEDALIKKVTYLAEKTNIRNLCIAGGVGLNCVANRKVLDNTPIENIFIQPSSGDTGQALGNALFGYHSVLGQSRKCERFSPYLGPKYNLSLDYLEKTLPPPVFKEVELSSLFNPPLTVADMLNKGKIVAWYQGQSEYGPRALGNRSILADPRYPAMRERCHILKKREFFRPFAPSVLEEYSQNYFDLDVPSPYMLLVAKANPKIANKIPAVLHEDNSARLQTVSQADNSLFYELISQFHKITGVPLVLNTSFNNRGEPIVETPSEAINTFLDLDLDALVLGNVLVEKKTQPAIAFSNQNGVVHEYMWQDFDQVDLAKLIGMEIPNVRLVGRSIMGIYSEHIRLMHAGKKSTSIRYRPNAIEYPLSNRISLLNTGANGRKFQAYPIGELLIKKLVVKRFGLLDDLDANREGYSSKNDLVKALNSIYHQIQENEYISIYHIELVHSTVAG